MGQLPLRVGCLVACLAGTAALDRGPAAFGPLGAPLHGGRITGKVTLGPQLTARRMKFSLYAPDPSRPSPAQAPPADEFRNVVVYIEAIPLGSGSAEARPTPPAIAQQKLSFTPHVLAVVKGTTVEFPNEDTVFHNVFSLSKVASFDLGRYPRGASKSVRFTTPGIVKVFCHIHSDMSAIIVVLDNPYFTSPDSQGQFVLDGIPPGQYRVVAWHERARLLSHRVRIDAGAVSVVDFDIPLTDGQDGG
jgi:plastocyanin